MDMHRFFPKLVLDDSLWPQGRGKRFKPGAIIDVPDGAIVLLKAGTLKGFLASEDQGLEFATLSPGTVFGKDRDLGLAMLNCRIFAGDNGATCQFVKEEKLRASGALYDLLYQAALRGVEATEELMLKRGLDVIHQVSEILLKLAGDKNEVVGYSHQNIADDLGVFRETVTNALAELKERGLIKIKRTRLEFTERTGLVKMANPL